MRPVAMPGSGADASLGSCLCALLEVEVSGTPGATGPHAWQEWLAARNLRLIRAAELPASGFWIGADERGEHVVMFGAPPDVIWAPGGGAPGPIVAGYVLAPLDPALPARLAEPSAAEATGIVAGLFIAERREGRCVAVDSAQADAGLGLRGDRYHRGEGTFSAGTLTGRNLTLIEAEALEELAAEHGIELDPADARRNVLTRGISLNDLVGREFTVGEARCLGARWCEPCAHLQRLTVRGTLRGLVHRGGLRADILEGGRIAIGDRVAVS